MEQDILREFEKKCIQAEPAYCTAQCPFHMDVKSFMGHMTKKDMESAFKVVEKSLPIPEIMARICDHPCENSCIRKEIDQSVAIGALERVCAINRSKQKKRFKLPSKDKKVGIWGSGLSSLTAAFDLILKGYDVAVHDKGELFGGNLLNLPEAILPASILRQQLKELESYGVSFIPEVSMDGPSFQQQTEKFDAIYLGFDSKIAIYPISYGENDTPQVDVFSLQTKDPHIFAGGFADNLAVTDLDTHPKSSLHLDLNANSESSSGYDSPVAYAAQGRKAATSIDRFLSNVSITAGREREGSSPTRLSTDTGMVEQVLSISPADPKKGYDLEEASVEAGRCIQCDCSRCIRVCTYIDSFKGYPGRYAREIYNNAAIVMGEKKANLLINSCSLCNLCETVCPNDFSMAELCLLARRDMVGNGKMPISAHEFALNEMAWASGEECFFARHEPGYDYSERIFFPGCQLIGSAPGQVKKVYDFLKDSFTGGTGFVSGCCGAPAQWAGQEALLSKNIEPFREFWEASGRPVIITACTSCTLMVAKALKGSETLSLFQLMAKNMDEQTTGLISMVSGNSGRPEPICIIDPCSARDDIEIQSAIRKLVRAAGIQISELPASGHLTECCGFGGLVYNANPALSKDIIAQRAAQSSLDFLAYCAMCRDRLASTGKKVIHLLDLFWPETELPEERKDPGFSRRHDNLALAKQEMLKQIWNEKEFGYGDDNQGSSKGITINISSEVEQVLEKRYILRSDIEKVVNHFERGAPHFIDPETHNIIAYYRPVRVCFWVEFRRDDAVYEILNSWSHRMEVVANSNFATATPTQPHDPPMLCSNCNQRLEYYKNHVEYLTSRFDVALPQCDKCGIVFVSQTLADGKMAEVEKILEDK